MSVMELMVADLHIDLRLFAFLLRSLSPLDSGYVLFAGQLADAVSTPLVGIFSDASRGCPRMGLGRRKLWNLIGSVIVALVFLLVFSIDVPLLLSNQPSNTMHVVYFCIAASLFNVGWAAGQVSHMAMVPELSPHPTERVMLNSARYAATVLANVAVFVAFFGLLKGMSPDGVPTKSKYNMLGYISVRE